MRLGGWSPQLPTGFRVSRGTQVHSPTTPWSRSATGLSPAPVGLPRPFASRHHVAVSFRTGNALQPRMHCLAAAQPVWAPARFARHYYGPLPVAIPQDDTGVRPCGPTVDSASSGYLDVSVPPVPPTPSTEWSRPITDEGLPHSESAGSSLACSSPATFRRAPRPSSAPGP